MFRVAGRSDYPRWDAYVASHNGVLPYMFSAWRTALEDGYGLKTKYFLAEAEDGEVLGVLPTARISFPFFGGIPVSLPYCDAGGVLTDSADITVRLLNYALEETKYSGKRMLELRSAVPLVQEKVRNGSEISKVRMVMELPNGSDVLLGTFKSKLRSQVLKPERDGLRVHLGGQELLPEFYAVHCENMKDLGSPAHSFKWFAAVVRHFGVRCRVGVVYMPDQSPAAAGILLFGAGIASVPWASSLKRFNSWNPNMLLYWSFLAFASDSGIAAFDFGRSSPNAGTYRFKAQWGAQPAPLHWYRLSSDPGAHLEGLVSMQTSTQERKSRRFAAQVIQHLPLAFANILGPRIRPFISL